MTVRITTRLRPALLAAPLLAALPARMRASDAAARICSAAPTGLVIFIPQPASEPVAGLTVADAATGEPAGTVDLPPIDRLTALRVPGKALAVSTEGAAYLVDAAAATSTPLDVPPDLGGLFELRLNLPVGPGDRYTILGDGREALLLDTADGAVTDLRPLLGPDAPPVPLFNPALSPGERHVLLWDGRRQWLIPTGDTAGARALSDGPSLGGSFSPDGSLLIYGRQPASGEGRELVVEPVDGSAAPEVIAAGRYVNGVFVGGNRLIALNRHTFDESSDEPPVATFALHDRASGSERVLLTYDVNPVSLLPAPDGSHLLFALQGVDAWQYAMTDVASGRMSDVPFVTGLVPIGPVNGRYRLLYPATGVSEGAEAPGYYAVDLEAGTSTILAPTEVGNAIVNTPPAFSLDGSGAIGVLTSPEVYRLWHFDLAGATATVATESPVGGASLSPDGCWLALAPLSGESGARTAGVRVQSPDGSTVVELGPGRQPVWVSQ